LHHSPLHQTTKHLERVGDSVFGIAGGLGDKEEVSDRFYWILNFEFWISLP
jgi:hypothetical protein